MRGLVDLFGIKDIGQYSDDFGACGNPQCRGYDAFGVGREPGIELQACGSCTNRSDDWAAVQFVRDLERGERHAHHVLPVLLGAA